MIVHALPGRIRLRHAAPPSRNELDALGLCVRAVAPSARLTHMPSSGSTLVEFTEHGLTDAVLSLLQGPSCGCTAPDRPAAVRSAPAAGSASARVFRWPSMSVVKRGMTGSLLVSLGLAALRREGGHGLTGGIFLVFLSRHLWVYRKRLLK
ncbi:hypothetical protein [Desulfobulbus elongatus]|uniref:hypothetical protein n=1 Tax=Desulfobulbus elongatus TaxID=53332 RepID=UPI000480B7C4|nr:hypothetical protein [Desulfobulbus elongatus]